ncbi:DUF190 domain-containing protein [Pelagibacterium limicola]|uniref:DUF190 domain-containing protein n=1 Tax=Pelagibacterium limicola TaxID=2791022 RepID=UPI0018AF5910|nr:DUF190 domain-containing protein [Pelagibacterium limicola]
MSITTTQRVKIEVLVDAPLVRLVVAAAKEAGVTGHTLLRALGGEGSGGAWREDRVTGAADTKLVFLTVTTADAADRLVEALTPLLDSYRLIVWRSPVEVIRSERF